MQRFFPSQLLFLLIENVLCLFINQRDNIVDYSIVLRFILATDVFQAHYLFMWLLVKLL